MFTMLFVACAFAMQDAPPTETESPPTLDPVIYDILRNADEATEAVSTVRYDAVYEGTGSQAVVVPLIKGQIIIAKSDTGKRNLKMEYTTYQVKELEGSITKTTGLFQGSKMLILDHAKQVAIKGNASFRALGQGNNLYMSEFASPNPFEDEINANLVTLEGRAYVAETLCDVLLIDYNGRSQSRWFIGVDDHLPRRIERLRDRDGIPGARILTISNLEVNFEADDSEFALEIPSGYAIRRMAPASNIGQIRSSRGRPDGR